MWHTATTERNNTAPGSIFNIHMQLHSTWVLAIVLITIVVVTQYPEAYPLWRRLILGFATSLLFFVSATIRELVLRMIALRKGIPVKRFVQYLSFSVYHVVKETTSPSVDLLIALAGMIASLAFIMIFYFSYLLIISFSQNMAVASVIQWLAYLWLALWLIHLLPAYPLDGGRMVSAILWRATGKYYFGIRITSWIGRVLGLGACFGGLAILIESQQWFLGIFLIFSGWSIYSAANLSLHHVAVLESLEKNIAGSLMVRDFLVVPPDITINRLVHDYILVSGERYLTVTVESKLQGIVELPKLRKIPKKLWGKMTVHDVMTPAHMLVTAHPDQDGASLFEVMDDLDFDALPVVRDGEVLGVVFHDSLARLARVKLELKI